MPNTKKSETNGGARATIDHDEIRAWVEQHGGTPATVKRTRRGDTAGIIRIDFPGYSGERSLEPISWEEFFEKFDESNLALLVQDRTASGRPSRFNKFVSRETVDVVSTKGSSEDETSDQTPKSRRTTKTRRKAPQSKRAGTVRATKTQPRTPARGTRRGASTGTPARSRTARSTSQRAKKTTRASMPSASAQPRTAKRAKSSSRKKTTTRRATSKKSSASATR